MWAGLELASATIASVFFVCEEWLPFFIFLIAVQVYNIMSYWNNVRFVD